MQKTLNILKNESGTALVIVLLVLVMLTLIGKTMMNTSSVDVEMAGNYTRHKAVFYEADSSVQISCEVLEQAIACQGGMGVNTEDGTTLMETDYEDGVMVENPNLIANGEYVDGEFPDQIASSDIYFPPTAKDDPNIAKSLIKISEGGSGVDPGNSIKDHAEYEKTGSGHAGTGYKRFAIIAHRDNTKDDYTIRARWNHVLGQEGDCNYD